MTEHVVTDKQVKNFMNSMDKDIAADLCAQITKELAEACKAVGDKYVELEHKFPELISVIGLSVIVTCNAVPIDDNDPPVCIVMGTQKGLQHAAQPLIKTFSSISQEAKHDKG